MNKISIQKSISLNTSDDFITNIKASQSLNQLAFIHQLNFIQIKSYQESQSVQNIQFESNVYDAEFIETKIITSNNHMPVRIFDIAQEGQPIHLASFYDRKPNSEYFLTPLQFAISNQKIIGGGKKFLSCYDCHKNIAFRYKRMDKKYISAVQFIQNTIVTGQFNGEIQLLDPSNGQIVHSIKPHMDFVTKIKKIPENQNTFLTLARKDNLCYQWDRRNLNQFVTYFEHPRNKNQRSGLEVSKDGNTLYIGGQNGQIFIHSLKQNESQSLKFELKIPKTVSSLCRLHQNLYCGVGQRSFPILGEKTVENCLLFLSLHDNE